MSKKDKELKDFLYLDFERVRSFAAQMFAGEVQSKTTDMQRNSGIRAKVSAGVSKLLGLEAEPNMTIIRSKSETKSLHHQLYIDFEDELGRLDKLSHIDNEGDSIDKPFVRISGSIQIIDYKNLIRRLDKTFGLMDYFKKMELEKVNAQSGDRNAKAKLEAQINNKFNKPKEFDDIVDMIEAIYGDSLMLNIYVENSLFAKANLSPRLFQFESSGIISGTESLIDEEWIVLGQIINKQEKPRLSTQQGNKFDEVFAGSFLPIYKEMRGMIESSAQYEIIPIAIYRKL